MSMSFFLPISTYPDPTPKSSLLRAFDMAATLGGEVTALVHEVDIGEVHNVVADALVNISGMIAAAEARSRAAAKQLIEEVNHLAHRFQIGVTVHTVRSRPEVAAALFAQRARTFDCSLLMPLASSEDQAMVAEAVLFGSGGPAWLFPPGDVTSHLASAAVAWDGSRAAARAVRDALPILSVVKHVTILSATDDKPVEPTTVGSLQDFLRRHEIAAEVHLFSRSERAIGEALQQAALDRGAGLLVMGAYGHSRIREFVLGGATRTVLADRRMPILMSH
jgi:nucleotide-binding universal stress UspA family protein